MWPFIEKRWRGGVELETVFLRDMLLLGSGITLAAALAAWGLREAGQPAAAALAVSLLPVPLDMFLFVAVWRSAGNEGGPAALPARAIAVMWLAAMLVML